MMWVRTMSFDVLFLGLASMWSVALTDATPSELRTSTSSYSARPSAQVFSSIVFPFVSAATQTLQSSDNVEKLPSLKIPVVDLGKAIHNVIYEYVGKPGVPDPTSVAKSVSEVIGKDADAILSFGSFLKAVINSIGRYLVHRNVLSAENYKLFSDSYLSAAVSALRNVESSAEIKSIVEDLSDVSVEFLSSHGIFDEKHVPVLARYFQDELRSLVGDKDLYTISSKGDDGIKRVFDVPYELPIFASPFRKCSFGEEPYSFLEGLLLCPSLKFPTSSPKQKRSAPRQSFYTMLSNFIESSTPLSKGLEKAVSPESKKDFDSIYRGIRNLLDFEEKDEKLATSLYKTMKSTLEHRAAKILIKAIANSIEKLLTSTHRLTPKTYDEISQSFLAVLKEGEDVLDPEEDELSHVKAMGISIYRFLTEQKVTSTENVRYLVSTLVSELNSLSETSTPSPE